ncbi:MAG: hypothetical protein KatS3mg095_0237 [Candidatus Parcubacteria bacterium]|nr:MAG: hypothetical protein KatS3mg095_0237 [Candidatus Parcubacteria bacterium]
MIKKLTKNFIINILIFIIIYVLIFFLVNYLTKRIFNLAQEINNLVIEKELRLNNHKKYITIQKAINRIENKYNLNLENLNKEIENNFINKKNISQILELTFSAKINISTTSENLKFIFNDNLENLLKLFNLFKKNNLILESIEGKRINNNLNLEIKIK